MEPKAAEPYQAEAQTCVLELVRGASVLALVGCGESKPHHVLRQMPCALEAISQVEIESLFRNLILAT
jgi:hypothetical protein